ncbi:MAG: class I SAM-dependent methyltransferase [Chloroflexota bacterium]
MRPPKRQNRKPGVRTSWDPVAAWYQGMVGEGGSKYHRTFAIPAILDLLAPQKRERILDIGCGPGPLAPFIAEAGARYTGVDASERLLRFARQHHGNAGRFLVGDARKLTALDGLQANSFDAAVFLLSIQDMDPLDQVLQSAAWSLCDGGRIVLLMTHPCFRVPRQSGWGWDEGRKLRYRRVDRYLTPLPVPMKPHPGDKGGVTRSFHRPLSDYINGLSACGLLIDQVREIPKHEEGKASSQSRADTLADQEIPLFLGIRAVKVRN